MAETANIVTLNDNETPLIPAATAIETFRDAGYKSTAAALAELIDNSIEAGAKNIQVLTFEEPVQRGKREIHKIVKVAVYDDGDGMDIDTLQMSLQFGVGTRMDTRNGMGRFGIGLPNASVSQCRHVEVYSWQNGECYKTYLDVDEIKEHKRQNANPVTKCDMPTDILEHIQAGHDNESGTLVIWEKCDRLDVSYSNVLYKRMEKDLCRIYRHFLDNDNTYGNKVNVSLVTIGREKIVRILRANDPMYLLTPNNVPGYENEATNVGHGSVVTKDIPYDNEGNTSTIEIRFSIALPEIQNLGGNSDVGKHYKANTGISFLRACREIDFGSFGFVLDGVTPERWWGCEIRFDPILDDLFGVTNNKQGVRGIKKIDIKEFNQEHDGDWEEEIKHDLKLNLCYQISKTITKNLGVKDKSGLRKTLSDRKVGSNSGGTEPSVVSNIANEELKRSKAKTKSQIEAENKSKEESTKEWLDSLQKQNNKLSSSELQDLAEQKSQLIIDKELDSWRGELFFSIETRGGTSVLIINTNHPFYTELYEPLSKEDANLASAIDLLMMAYARAEDELCGSYDDELGKVRSRWGGHLQDFLKALKKAA